MKGLHVSPVSMAFPQVLWFPWHNQKMCMFRSTAKSKLLPGVSVWVNGVYYLPLPVRVCMSSSLPRHQLNVRIMLRRWLKMAGCIVLGSSWVLVSLFAVLAFVFPYLCVPVLYFLGACDCMCLVNSILLLCRGPLLFSFIQFRHCYFWMLWDFLLMTPKFFLCSPFFLLSTSALENSPFVKITIKTTVTVVSFNF